MKRIQRNTISFRLLTLLLIIFMLLISLVIANNIIAIRDIQNNAFMTMKENLTMYNNRLNDNFKKAENYLVNFAYDDVDILILDTKPSSSSLWFSSLYRIQKSFNAALPIYKMDGFFLYSLPKDTIVTETNSSYQVLQSIKDAIRPLMKDNTLINKDNKDKWFPVQINDQYYLFRILRIHDSYIGTWISTDTAIYPLVGDKLNKYIFLVNNTGNVLSGQTPVKSLPAYALANQDNYQQIKINGKTNLLVPAKINFMNSYIVALMPENQLFVETHNYIILLIIALLFIFCLMILTVIITKRWVIQPLSNLFVAISSLRSGNLKTEVNAKNVSAEFNDVYQAFNEMVSEIRSLKIDIYEEKLSRQNVHMQYLKMQIAPHFLINCISMVYQLLEIGKFDLSKIMLKDLSNHLRYTLSSGKTVSLRQELIYVENYIELSKIRYPGSINLYTDCESDTLSATVIPLLLNNFVENTIKYEVVMNKPIDIHIRISLTKNENKDFLSICIWDTGSGYNEKMLSKLQNISEYIKDTEHIGISNVFERASFIYGMDNCHFQFSNRPGAGAQVEIELPFILFNEEEGH